MRQMPMRTETTTLHRTSPLAWHCTLSTLTSTSTESAHHERAQSCSLCTFIHTHIGSSSTLVRTPLTTIIVAIHVVVVSSTSLPPLTSSPSSCLSSSFPSSTSATRSSRSSTRRSWKTCATTLPTGVRAPTTSSTSPQTARAKHPQKNQAIKRKALQTEGAKFHADSNSINTRQVSSGILPCVRITSLKKGCVLATNPISDILRQKESPTKGQRKVVQKDQLRY